MRQKIMICADEDKILTDGKIYGKIIYLGKEDKVENYYEITKEEYQQILANKASEELIEEE